MMFVNAAMLLGLAGAAIPVLVHLIGRREPPRVEFPALRFLMTQLTVQRRRLNVQRWALLLLRMAMIALVVLALAQPRILGRFGASWVSIGGLGVFATMSAAMAWIAWRGHSRQLATGLALFALLCFLSGGVWFAALLGAPVGPMRSAPAEAAVGLILDNSVRLLVRDGDQTRFDEVKATANWLLDEFPPGSRFGIFDRTNRPVTFALDQEAARRSVAAAEPVAVEESLERRLEAAIRLVRTSELPHRSVYVITDLSAAGWESSAAESLHLLLEEEPKVAVQFIDLGASVTENWRVEEPVLPALPLASGVPGQISVNVFPPEGMTQGETQVELLLYANDPTLPMMKGGQVQLPKFSVVDRQTARVGEKEQVLLNLPPLEAGIHRGIVRIDSGDVLPIDNQVSWCIEVASPPRVLIVGQDPVERRVMSGVLSDPNSPADEFKVTSISPDELNNTNLTEFDAAVWLDPPALVGPLATWAQGGGKLLVSMGPSWKGDAKLPSLPLTVVRKWRVPAPGTYLDLIQPDYPVLSNLGSGNVSWPQYPVRIYWQLELGEGVLSPIRMAGTGDPAFIDAPWGSGRLLLFTTHIPGSFEYESAWNQLLSGSDAWPTWLMLRQAINLLARPDTGLLNVTAGTSVYLPQRSSDPLRYQLFSPTQQVVSIEASGDTVVPGPALDIGLYWLRGEQSSRGYAVRLHAGQTDLRRVTPANLETWLGAEHFSMATNRQEVKWAEGSGAGSQPLYAQAMLAAVLIWLLEHTLANRFYQRK